MTTKYNFENYEITLTLTSDNITINILDAKLYQLYRKSYSDIHIIDYCPNIDIFYTVLKTSFECLSTNDMTKADIIIRPSSLGLNININHKFYVKFTFDLHLDLDKNNTLSAKDLCIKKLENDIGKLRSEFNSLRYFIDDYMEVSICDDSKCLAPIKVNTKQINITFIGGSQYSYTIDKTTNICNMCIGNSFKFNKNFNIINCDKIIIIELSEHHVNGLINLPNSLKEIIIQGGYFESIKQFIKTIKLNILEKIEFVGCNDLTSIYADIKHLKIKKIRMTGCPKFTKRDLLLTNGYKFEVY
jgi:hypothetical protein